MSRLLELQRKVANLESLVYDVDYRFEEHDDGSEAMNFVALMRAREELENFVKENI